MAIRLRYKFRYGWNRLLTACADSLGLGWHRSRSRMPWFAAHEARLDRLLTRRRPAAAHYIVETSAVTASRTLANHLCAPYAGSGAEVDQNQRHEIIQRLLHTLADYFEQHGVEYWLDGGLLLGAYRHGAPIPWDVDGDVSLSEAGLERLINVIDDYPFPGSDCVLIFRRMRTTVPHYGLASDLLPCILVDKTSGVYIDCFLVHRAGRKGLRMYWHDECYRCRCHALRLPRKVIYPLGRLALHNRYYPVPHDVKRYLIAWYGDLEPRRM